MPFKKKYSHEKLSNAILMIVDEGMPIAKVAKLTLIHIRTLQRHKKLYLKNPDDYKEKKEPDYPEIFRSDVPVSNSKVQTQLDNTMLKRVRFLEDVFNVKLTLLAQLEKVGKKSQNVDALQRSIKTLNDIEKEVTPEGDAPMVHAKTVNVFQLFNQNLEKNGYKGPDLTDADIVKGD